MVALLRRGVRGEDTWCDWLGVRLLLLRWALFVSKRGEKTLSVDSVKQLLLLLLLFSSFEPFSSSRFPLLVLAVRPVALIVDLLLLPLLPADRQRGDCMTGDGGRAVWKERGEGNEVSY